MSGRRISDQLSEAINGSSMFDELVELEDSFFWEEEKTPAADSSGVAGTPDEEDPTTDQALEPEELAIQRERIQAAVAKAETRAKVAFTKDTPGDFLITIPASKDPLRQRSRIVKVEKLVRNLGFQVSSSKDGTKLFVYAETPEPPPMEGG